MTATLLLQLPLRDRRDVLLARQRALQLARLLHLPARQQIHLAAGAFAVAGQALGSPGGCQLRFQVENQAVHVVFLRTQRQAPGEMPEQPLLQLTLPLPAVLPLALDDIRFVLNQVPPPAAVDSFTNLEQMNQEILALLHALIASQDPLEKTAPHLAQPAA